jgi:hypothetical protein
MDGDKDGLEPRKKVRSPSFPFVGLREALDRARAFYEAEQRNSARIETAASHWGYSPKSSGGKQTIAALRSFGLLDGDSLVKLSGRALRILLDERLDERGGDSEERRRLVQQAALLPPIHARLWERYGAELPSPQTLKLSLILDEGFNESSVDHFLTEYRETLEYARLMTGPAREETATPPTPPPVREARRVTAAAEIEPVVFPLLDGNAVEFRIRRAISAEEAEDVRVVFELWLRKIVVR